MPKFTFMKPQMEASGDRFSMACENAEGLRFHIWLNADLTLCQTTRTVFKNPPADCARYGDPRSFKTRHLSADKGGEGKAAMDYLMAQAPICYPAAVAALEAKDEAADKMRAAAKAARLIEEAAPELYAAIVAVISASDANDGDALANAVNDARAAQAKATNRLAATP